MGDVTQFGSITGGKTEQTKLPVNDYVLVDLEGTEHFATGFLIFTAQHVAVMRDEGTGAIPLVVLPMTNFKSAELYEDDETDTLF